MLHVVRHAHAGQRSAWTGDDRLRPLSERGEGQARGIAADLADVAPARLLSSPAARCVQTLGPLSEKLGVDVVEDDRLFEGAGRDEIAELLDEVADDHAVVCSHGDVIPILLDLLVERGMHPDRGLVWQKGSRWSVERDRGAWGAGRYAAPPDRR